MRHLRSGAMRRALACFGIAFSADWAFTVAVGLVAYADGGALAVGLVTAGRLLPAAALAPVLSAYADRVPRERVVAATCGARGLLTLGLAVALVTDAPGWVVYGLVVVATVAFLPFRASHAALLPGLCTRPEELTAANVARGALYSLSLVLGPLCAAGLVGLVGLPGVFAVSGVAGLLAAALVLGIRYERPRLPARPPATIRADLATGWRAVSRTPGVGLVVACVVVQSALRGAFTVGVVVIAVDLLGHGQAAVGLLQSGVGVGALVGTALVARLGGSRTMARALGVGVVLWGVPLCLVGAVPSDVTAVVAVGLIGLGTVLVDVTGFTLLGRMVPDEVLARVYGVREALGAVGLCLGSLAAPLAAAAFGQRGGLVAVGAVAPVVCLLAWTRLRRIDREVHVRTEVVHLLRRVAMFRPLPVPVVEQLARAVRLEDVDTGAVVMRAGEVGEFYAVVETGRVDVVDAEADDARVVRSMGTGEGFGEIALLGAVQRTMTVRAGEPTRLALLDAEPFLRAIASIDEAGVQAQAARDRHLSHAPGASFEE